jgi:hypothetical protein
MIWLSLIAHYWPTIFTTLCKSTLDAITADTRDGGKRDKNADKGTRTVDSVQRRYPSRERGDGGHEFSNLDDISPEVLSRTFQTLKDV